MCTRENPCDDCIDEAGGSGFHPCDNCRDHNGTFDSRPCGPCKRFDHHHKGMGYAVRRYNRCIAVATERHDRNDLDKIKMGDRLSCLYTDLQMLLDGSWVPDGDSVDASITMLECITLSVKEAGLLSKNYALKDTRKESCDGRHDHDSIL